MTQKIIICGFPHSGTTILKSIMGHIDEIDEIYEETQKINKETNKKFILCKSPFTYEKFFKKEYDDYIKIIIIRNPLYIFSSLNKRFNYNIPEHHSFDIYVNTIKLFINYKNTIHKNIYTIKYEDMFDNNFQELKNIFNNIGINYTNNIFDNSKYINISHSGVKLEDKKPKNIQHSKYRTWQINQPFKSNNNVSNIDLTEKQKQLIINNKYCLVLYPNNTDIIK